MPTYVDSTSTWEEVAAEYEDTASYDVASDTDLCKRFIVAGRILLRRLQTVAKNGDGQVEMDPAQVSAELKKAETWLASNDVTAAPTANRGGVRRFGLGNFRE